MTYPVMSPEAGQSAIDEFSDKVPPRFDGHSVYASCREGIVLSTNLTTLPEKMVPRSSGASMEKQYPPPRQFRYKRFAVKTVSCKN